MAYLGWLLILLGVAQCLAGAGGVDRVTVRVGVALFGVGAGVVITATVMHFWSL